MELWAMRCVLNEISMFRVGTFNTPTTALGRGTCAPANVCRRAREPIGVLFSYRTNIVSCIQEKCKHCIALL
jgi:hypothetical protein